MAKSKQDRAGTDKRRKRLQRRRRKRWAFRSGEATQKCNCRHLWH